MPGPFNEADHPRADDGKFGSGGGASGGSDEGRPQLKTGLDEATRNAIRARWLKHLETQKKNAAKPAARAAQAQGAAVAARQKLANKEAEGPAVPANASAMKKRLAEIDARIAQLKGGQ